MNLFKIKKIICNNYKLYKMLDILLNFYVECRYIITKSYTRDKEDRIAEKILNTKFKIQTNKIKYYDIGANDYKRGNNTFLISAKGGEGVLVEADTVLCEKLKKRKNDIVLNCAVSDKNTDEKMKFYICSLPTRSTLDYERASKLIQEGLKIVNVIDIPNITFEEIFKKTKIEPDLLSIDIEGYDFAVLKSIDFKEHPIKVIIVEDTLVKDEKGFSLEKYMNSKGYSTYIKTYANVIFVKSNYN